MTALPVDAPQAGAMPALRILLSIHHPPLRDSGAAGVVLRLAEEYRAAGHVARVLSFGDLPRWLPPAARQLLFPLALARAARRWRPDVVDASSGDGWLLFGARRARRALFVSHSHGLEALASAVERRDARTAARPIAWSQRCWRHGLRLRLVARAFRRADMAFVLNAAEAGYLSARLRLPAIRVHRVRLGTDHAGRPPADAPPPAGAPPARIGVVQIGAYSSRKGVAQTVAAMTHALRRWPAMTMSFLGTGVGAEPIVAAFPPDLRARITVVPRFGNGELPALLAGAAICLMPSAFEGYGIAKLEAMALGLVPIVSDDPGAATDITDGVDGLVVGVGDAAALARAIDRLAGDAERRDGMARTARATAARFTWRAVAAERLALYRTGLADRALAEAFTRSGVPTRVPARSRFEAGEATCRCGNRGRKTS